MTEITGRLENWHMVFCTETEDQVIGDIYSDTKQRWKDGTPIFTSGILRREYREGDIIQTRNSTYLLGKPYKIPGDELH